MTAIVVKRKADQDRVHAEHALELADNRYRAALADGHRLRAPFGSKCRARLGHCRIVERKFDGRRTGKTLEFHCSIGGKPRAHERPECFPDFLWGLGPDKA